MAIGIAAALGTAAAWALASLVMSAQARHVDPYSLSALRMLAATIFFVIAVPALGATGEFGRMSLEDIGLLFAQGLLASGIGETLYAVAIPLFGLSRTFTITTGVSVLAAFLFGALFLGDAVTITIGIGSLIVLAGVYLVANYGRPSTAITTDAAMAVLREEALAAEPPRAAWRRFCDQHRFAIGLSLAIFLGVLFGAASVLLRYAAEGFDAAAAASVRVPVVLPFVFTVALVQPRSSLRRWSIPRHSLPWILLSGAVGTGLLAVLVTLSLQHISAGEFTVFFSVSPLIGMAFGALFLGERVTRWLWLGALIVIGGIAVMALA